jgi:uncharacterized protein (TIGR00369 family)
MPAWRAQNKVDMTNPESKAATSLSDGLKLDFPTLAKMVRNCPFHLWLGVTLTKLEPHSVEVHMPWREEFVSDPEIRYTHGGILAALIDLAADYAIAARLGRGVPTIDMRIDYHKAAMPGPLLARARVIKLGGTLATAEAQLYDEHDALIASGRGVYLTRSR